MSIPCHPLFSPLGTLRIKTPAYYRIHADLVWSYQDAKSALATKKQRAEIRSRRYRQTGDVHG